VDVDDDMDDEDAEEMMGLVDSGEEDDERA
jgi:hypothetical protein